MRDPEPIPNQFCKTSWAGKQLEDVALFQQACREKERVFGGSPRSPTYALLVLTTPTYPDCFWPQKARNILPNMNRTWLPLSAFNLQDLIEDYLNNRLRCCILNKTNFLKKKLDRLSSLGYWQVHPMSLVHHRQTAPEHEEEKHSHPTKPMHLQQQTRCSQLCIIPSTSQSPHL